MEKNRAERKRGIVNFLNGHIKSKSTRVRAKNGQKNLAVNGRRKNTGEITVISAENASWFK